MTNIDFTPLTTKVSDFFHAPSKECARIFHGRGGCYKGLEWVTIDWFAPVVWVVVYRVIEPQVLSSLKDRLRVLGQNTPTIKNILIQQRLRPDPIIETIYGETPDTLEALESGCRFQLNLTKNQNTGFFLDTQPARSWVLENSHDKNVLNLFAYTCAFSVMALKGGASQVVNMDMMKSAIATGRVNHRLNDQLTERSVFYAHEIFRSLGKLRRHAPFDLVVIDPPSFQKGAFDVKKDYAKLLRKLPSLLAPKATLLLCLNAPYINAESFQSLVKESLPGMDLVKRVCPREDYPDVDIESGVKMLLFEYSQRGQ
ncbi:MAG: class I SAM-dependent methyltransferase [Cellvibrionales bacterium]|nr:class I SAM-dependent methyltransferase [Cellvibrionales bacterium]